MKTVVMSLVGMLIGSLAFASDAIELTGKIRVTQNADTSSYELVVPSIAGEESVFNLKPESFQKTLNQLNGKTVDLKGVVEIDEVSADAWLVVKSVQGHGALKVVVPNPTTK